ncbi:arsenate reductase/protein-tyrosine-phosphatase family protein [Acidimangrovimonas pyrenivorans]|uniref:ArsR family transcriptional regulator n=1 Tax=Acidimangrovimonas pyrenivorans TaxID=2030798 RepID=A0ABV7AH28_9RHOB
MESNTATILLAALAHEGRLAVFRLLVRRMPEGVRPSGIALALDLKPNTLSQYLSVLEQAGLVQSERQGRAVLYRADMARMGKLVDFLVADCCRGRPDLCAEAATQALTPQGTQAMTDRPLNVLFICTGNSARSIFAEALLRDLGGDRFRAFSAGTRPAPELNPFAVELLRRQGHDIDRLRAKTTAEFQGPNAPAMDFVFTVCDTAANEDCPPWPGQPITAHWGLPDPVKVEGTDAEKSLAFAEAYAAMRRRVEAFTSLPLAELDRMSLQRRLDAIGGADV